MSGRAMPYSPMGQTVCTTTHEEMQAKLTRRVQEIAAKSLKPGEQVDIETGVITHVEQHTAQPLPERGPDAVADVVGTNPPARMLTWNKPVRNKDGTGHQLAAGTDYAIRKTLSKEVWMYWAWHARKLLGYSIDVEAARNHCESHYRENGT